MTKKPTIISIGIGIVIIIVSLALNITKQIGTLPITADIISINETNLKHSDTIGSIIDSLAPESTYKVFVAFCNGKLITPDIWTLPAKILKENRDSNKIKAELRLYETYISKSKSYSIYIENEKVDTYD